MLASAIEIITPFPNEKIRLKAPKTVPSINGIRFDSVFKRYNSPNQQNSSTSILSSEPYILYDLNPDNHIVDFIFPTRFPLVWAVNKNNDLFFETEIVGVKGVSGCTVFPTSPFPLLKEKNDYSVGLSAVLIQAQKFNESSVNLDWNGYDISYDLLLDSGLKSFRPLTTYMQLSAPYYASTRKNDVFSIVTHQTSKLSADFPPNMIPASFELSVPITNTNPVNSPIGYTGTSQYTIFDPARNGLLKGRVRSDLKPDPIVANVNYSTGKFGLDYNWNYFVSGGNCEVSYRAVNSVPSTVSVYTGVGNVPITLPNLGTDYFTISTVKPIYFYSFPFTFQSTPLYAECKTPTLFWNLSSSPINNGASAVMLSSTMIDNYKQNWWSLDNSGLDAVICYNKINTFQDVYLADNLSCYIGNTYIAENQWVPASSTMHFINNGLFQTYDVQTTLSTFSDSIQKTFNKFILNKNKANFTVHLSSYTNSLVAELESDAILDPTIPIKWNFDKNEYISLFSLINNQPISNNTFVNFLTASKVSAVNMGVDATKVIAYSQEYNISAVNTWNPVSGSYANTTVQLNGSFDDTHQNPNGFLKASLNKSGRIYDIPRTSNIRWLMPSSDAVTISVSGRDSEIFLNTNHYIGKNGEQINFTVKTACSDSLPIQFNLPFRANVYDDSYNLTSLNTSFVVNEKPCNAEITFSILSGGEQLFNSADKCDVAVLSTGGYDFILSANTTTINVLPSNIHWFKNDVEFGTGRSIALSLSSNSPTVSSVSVSARRASAVRGNFPVFNYVDQFSFCFKNTLSAFGFQAYPVKQWNGTSFIEVNPTNSRGVSAYGNCHKECFIISATPGFDNYKFSVGEDQYNQTSNILKVCYSPTTTENRPISIFAYNKCYSENCPSTIHNSTESIPNNRLKGPIVFHPYETVTNVSYMNDTFFNLNAPFSENLVSLSTDFVTPFSPVQVLSGTMLLEMTDGGGNKKSQNLILNGNTQVFESTWNQDDPNSMFYIPANTVGIYDLKMSGTLTRKIIDQDFCQVTVPMPTKHFTLTAVNGPELAFYTETPSLNLGSPLTFQNDTVQLDYSFGLSSIKIDFGDGVVSAFNPNSLTGIHTYTQPGTYSWAVTGFLKNGLLDVVTYDNYIDVQAPQPMLVRDTQRNFPSEIILPYSCSDIADFSNDWIVDSTFNNKVQKIADNLTYIQKHSFIYDPDLPHKYLGWLGNHKGDEIKWSYFDYDNTKQQTFTDIRDIIHEGEYLFVIDGNSLKIYNNGYYPRLLIDKNTISEGEQWGDIKTIQKSGQVICLLDKRNKAVYYFKWNGKYNLKLLYYFGGWGNKNNKYKFNNPNDFSYFNQTTLICDTDNKCVKKYDSTFSWTETKMFDKKPISITQNANYIFVLFDDKSISKYDLSFQFLKTWNYQGEITDFSKIRLNDIFVFVNGSVVQKFTLNGSTVGTFKKQLSNLEIRSIGISENNIYLPEKDKIHKVSDTSKYFDLRDLSQDSGLFPLSAMLISPKEFVSTEVYNDSLNKINSNISTVFNSFSARFFEISNPCEDSFQTFETRAFNVSASDQLKFSQIGINEKVDYSTIGREFNNICYNLNIVKNVLNSQKVYPEYNFECLTWEDAMISNGDQCGKGGPRKPISWYELSKGLECTVNSQEHDNVLDIFKNIDEYPNVFRLPYSLSACQYITSHFSGVSCVSGTNGHIYIPKN